MRILIFMFMGWIAWWPDWKQYGEEMVSCSGVRRFEMPLTYIKDSAMADYDIGFYRIDIEMNDTSTFIRGTTTIQGRAVRDIGEMVFELSDELRVDSISVNGIRQPDFIHLNDLIRISGNSAIPSGQDFEAMVHYQGTGGGRGGFFSGISNRTDFQWNKRVTYTMSESFNAHDWFACKQVLTDKADSAYIYVTTPQYLKAGSNGILAGIDSLGNGKVRYKWETRYPVAYYLLSVTVADYQDYSFYIQPEQTPDSFLVQNFIFNDSAYLPSSIDEISQTAELLSLYSGLFGV